MCRWPAGSRRELSAHPLSDRLKEQTGAVGPLNRRFVSSITLGFGGALGLVFGDERHIRPG
jgi:hypothetical protein